MLTSKKYLQKYLQNVLADFSSSIVVFFCWLPLCLGIALASGAALFAGIISGVVGGIQELVSSSSLNKYHTRLDKLLFPNTSTSRKIVSQYGTGN